MFQYVVRRLVYGLITLLALSIITFTLLQNTGGDPLDRLKSNPRITQEAVQEMAEFYGLDRSAPLDCDRLRLAEAIRDFLGEVPGTAEETGEIGGREGVGQPRGKEPE